MRHDTGRLWQSSVPLVDQCLDALDLAGQFTVVAHLFQDVKHRLRANFTQRQDAHARDEHVHLFLNAVRSTLDLEQRIHGRGSRKDEGSVIGKVMPANPEKSAPSVKPPSRK